MKPQLANWVAQFNIQARAVCALLEILRRQKLDLPKDYRTLMATPIDYSIKNIAGGHYYYNGIKKGFLSLLGDKNLNQVKKNSCLSLHVNVDGLPLFQSSKVQLWPILGIFREFKDLGPFVIALFFGVNKPSSIDAYLQLFIDEIKRMHEHGIEIYDQRLEFKLEAFICDAPARSFLKEIKGHTGYNSCERCLQHGEWNGRLIFADHSSRLGTDQSFKMMLDEDHHQTISPLNELNFGMVSRFVLDYMHLVCLGVVRKIVFLWVSGPLKTRLSSNIVGNVSEALISLAPRLSKNFSRKPRSLTEVKMWKATEFRQFLLYTGPIVLFKKLSLEMYQNFMMLSTSIRLLLMSEKGSFSFTYIKQALEMFVKNFARIYGSHVLTYNVHNLLHLVDDAKLFGSLDNVSCFPFENFLGFLKQLISKHQKKHPIAQIIRRLEEKYLACKDHQETSLRKPNHLRQHFNGPVPNGYETYDQFMQYSSTNLFVSLSSNDNCFYIEESVCLIKNILCSFDMTFLVVSKFKKKKSF